MIQNPPGPTIRLLLVNNCGATDHSHRHLLCKQQYNCGATTQLDTLSGPLQTRSPLWRALRRSRKRLRTLADGCERKRKTWRTQPHPQTPKWNGNPRYAFGKKMSPILSHAQKDVRCDQKWQVAFTIQRRSWTNVREAWHGHTLETKSESKRWNMTVCPPFWNTINI